ncbi:hypothetical protein SDRG_04658 [Saprolegnia diclina VS20]|uniref:Uncharacterized protein n=1 Tax=Saprolegnia diclina (strain VS20) TaxID=1156394 RepID=T0QU36_SAPDV|nr:hypothetical protein SDRG_04658 [Saprolegnia diclina VS20]EQC38231.1 hypothetical protein SDRG_04658 [Saprolegnia diclina VS20]|eukprot:XP_008608558.1 hypothetical protein SDRG_04658 [Saprolegnia diclina VS20]
MAARARATIWAGPAATAIAVQGVRCTMLGTAHALSLIQRHKGVAMTPDNHDSAIRVMGHLNQGATCCHAIAINHAGRCNHRSHAHGVTKPALRSRSLMDYSTPVGRIRSASLS